MLTEALDDIFREGDEKPSGRVPVVTVVTDLNSAHASWFNPEVDALFVPSPDLHKLALDCKVPEERLHLCGLPVREGFWSIAPPLSRKDAQKQLELPAVHYPGVVLVMGGGEGFGKLYEVAVAIGRKLAQLRFGQLIVVCGRNDEVRRQLSEVDWEGTMYKPILLGFVTNVDVYMSAADLLVTKAGPGSIAEAMIKGLPCLLTSFIPGQEEGNVRFVTDGGAGEYVSEAEPTRVADTIGKWLKDPERMRQMSESARGLARPDATLEIARRMHRDFLRSAPDGGQISLKSVVKGDTAHQAPRFGEVTAALPRKRPPAHGYLPPCRSSSETAPKLDP